MLFVLGVGSLIALKGCAFTVILDAFPHLKTWHVSFCTAVIGFLVGLVYITPVSQYLDTDLHLFNKQKQFMKKRCFFRVANLFSQWWIFLAALLFFTF